MQPKGNFCFLQKEEVWLQSDLMSPLLYIEMILRAMIIYKLPGIEKTQTFGLIEYPTNCSFIVYVECKGDFGEFCSLLWSLLLLLSGDLLSGYTQ